MHRLITVFFILLWSSFLSAKPVDIVFWHSMAGDLGKTLNTLAEDFNQAHPSYQIRPIYKGDYTESLTSFSAAVRAKRPPSIIQVYEVGTAMMLAARPVIKPVSELMEEQGCALASQDFLPAVKAAYSEQGRLMAMPFNLSVPLIFYNADKLKQLGVKKFPKTWSELENLAYQLRQSGMSCAYTSAYPAWILLESYASINGIGSIHQQSSMASFSLNQKQYIKHLARLKSWQDKHYFNYAGRADEAMMLFTSGHCALLSQSSGSYRTLSELAPFKVGVALMPYDSELSASRHANVVGGAALWVLNGQTSESYRGIALFLDYLADPKRQAFWHQKTGYLPIGLSGQYASLLQKGQKKLLKLAMQDLQDQEFINEIRLPQNQLRSINEQALTALFAGLKSAKTAVNDANLRGNHVITRFMNNTKPTL